MSQFTDFISPLIDSSDYSLLPLAGDASTRRYYRVVHEKSSWVLMEWDPFTDKDSFPFLSVQKYFAKHGVRVPHVISYSEEKGLFLLEDLGDLTLERRFWEFQNQEAILPFYEKALDQLIQIHSMSFEDRDHTDCTAYQIEFSIEKLLWEMNYAKRYLLKELLELPISGAREERLDQEFSEICTTLYQSPQVICHRDYHSRNIMLIFDELAIIDFQDARLGPPAYDLVSLFYDSYVNLNNASIDHLMNYYVQNFKHYKQLKLSQEEWQKLFQLQTLQRCFKACGSFASFKMNRDDNRYLKYLKPTIKRLLATLPHWKENSEIELFLREGEEKWSQL